jgi:dihydrofolate reductase
MGKTVMGAVVSVDGFIADDNDDVGPLFDWYGNGDVTWAFEGADYECRTTQASADFMQSQYRDLAAVVIGRRLFDLTNGWNGKPAAGEHVFVVTHRPPTDWEHADTSPFTFVDGVEKAIAAAKEFAGDRVVDVAAGQIGSQALKLGLIDQVVVNRWSSAPAVRSSPPAAWPGRCGWRTRPRSCQATGSPTWYSTSAAVPTAALSADSRAGIDHRPQV